MTTKANQDRAPHHLLCNWVGYGWEVVQVLGIKNVRINEYDYTGKDYLIVAGVGITDEAIAYSKGIGSFVMINKGLALAKPGIFGIEIIDSLGHVQRFSKHKSL